MILQQQRPADSALYRAQFPEEYDRDKLVQRVELLAVLLVRGQMLTGQQTDIKPEDLPSSFDQIFGKPKTQEEVHLMTFDEIDERMGWGPQERAAPAELLTPEEIDRRMGW